ncbi:MAG TPA: cobalamin-binding protein [Candidatus Binataceae bacterium]|nr:cobalamin-binding protein [Candidatus Binataceae bacterium]
MTGLASVCGRWKIASSAVLTGILAVLIFGCRISPVVAANGSTRIVSLAPSVTETLFALGAGAEVVGVSQYCDYPPAARRLPKIGSFLTPNIEEIVALKPTLVIGQVTSADQREIRALQATGIATLMVRDSSVNAIEASIEKIGNAIHRPNAAHDLVRQIRSRISRIKEELAGVESRRVLMVVGHQPLVAVGPRTYLDELLELAHADNIADISSQSWPRLSLEYIIDSRPEVILDGQMGTDPHAPATFWARYPSIPAVRHHQVFGYPDDPTLHPGPRVAQTLELLAKRIHPEAFAEKQAAASHALGQ